MELSRLAEPFDPQDIEWRIQSNGESNGKKWALVLAYITSRAIQDRLDEVCGPDGWRNEFKEWHGTSQLCGISIWMNELQEWVTKWDGADATNIEATKGGLSDAMKRAGVQWGIGRYLYKLDTNFVNLIDGRGKGDDTVTVFIDKKNYHFIKPKLPAFALPMAKKPDVRIALAEKLAKESPRKAVAKVDDPEKELLDMKAEIKEMAFKELKLNKEQFEAVLLESLGSTEVVNTNQAGIVLEALENYEA